MGGKCQRIMPRVYLYCLVILTSVQTFERITFTEAALTYHDISTTDADVWKGLLFTAYGMTALVSPWLGGHIGLKNVARIGAFIALLVALFLFMIDTFADSATTFIQLVQALAPFAGISDCMLTFSILAGFINTTPPGSRGWSFGLLFAGVLVAFVLGIDHEGVLASLNIIDTTTESSFAAVCCFLIGICIIAQPLITRSNFEDELGRGDVMTGGCLNPISYQWWKTLFNSGVRWSCLVVISFALLIGYIKSEFISQLEDNYGWDTDTVMNISLIAILGFLFACPLVGWFGEKYGSLKLMTAGNFALAGALLLLAIVVDGSQGDQITVGFLTTLFGVCSTPSVVTALINMHENLEVAHETITGSATASLYIFCWIIGVLLGLGLEYQIDNKSFQEMAFECSGGETVLGLFAAVLSSLDLLKQPVLQDEFAKQLAADRLKKIPYVVENNWEALSG